MLDRFIRKHRDAHDWLAEWTRNVELADWRDLDDVKRQYPAADGGVKVRSGALVTVFNVKGNEYRLIADVVYRAGIVSVLELMTHAEYSKNHWKRRH